MASQEDYISLLTDLIKKQMVMLGPGVAVTNARKVTSLTISDDGEVRSIAEEPQIALNELANVFMHLSGQIAQTTLQSLLEKYPDIKKNN